ncbi:MAG: metal ABC transporter permease [Aquificota bacterium]|nr:MAG: metal ABC transporter permease [Aquificota bacterium]
MMTNIPPFLYHAFMAALFLALLLSLLSFFVVVQNWAFLGVGISHAAFGGVALGFLLGVSPDIPALIFAVAAAMIIGLVKRRWGLHEDTAIGILFSTAMGIGVILFSFSKGYTSDAFSYLFGNILTITQGDLWLIGGVTLLTYLFIGLFLKGLILMAINEDLAYVRGIPTAFLYYSLLLLLALAVVLAIKLVGVILVTALVVVPASVAMRMSTSYRKIILISLVVGLAVNLVGLAVSYALDLPPGATMAVTAGSLFSLSLILPRPS